MSEPKPLTEEEVANWVREAYQAAISHLAVAGIVTEAVSDTESRYLAPYIAVWKLKSNQNEWFWVTSGDVPTDHMRADSATDARQAIQNFSLRWQLKAENIRNAGESDTADAKKFESSAEMMYQAYEEQSLWQ